MPEKDGNATHNTHAVQYVGASSCTHRVKVTRESCPGIRDYFSPGQALHLLVLETVAKSTELRGKNGIGYCAKNRVISLTTVVMDRLGLSGISGKTMFAD